VWACPGDDPAAVFLSFGVEIHGPVGIEGDIQIVLDHNSPHGCQLHWRRKLFLFVECSCHISPASPIVSVPQFPLYPHAISTIVLREGTNIPFSAPALCG
jgi:hypothetical protein